MLMLTIECAIVKSWRNSFVCRSFVIQFHVSLWASFVYRCKPVSCVVVDQLCVSLQTNSCIVGQIHVSLGTSFICRCGPVSCVVGDQLHMSLWVSFVRRSEPVSCLLMSKFRVSFMVQFGLHFDVNRSMQMCSVGCWHASPARH